MDEYVGEVGTRLRITVEFTADPWHMNTKFGPTILYRAKDEDENIFVWFTDKVVEVKAGDRRRIRGTPKRHSEFRGQKQTLFTRVVVKGEGEFKSDVGQSFLELCKEQGIE